MNTVNTTIINDFLTCLLININLSIKLLKVKFDHNELHRKKKPLTFRNKVKAPNKTIVTVSSPRQKRTLE